MPEYYLRHTIYTKVIAPNVHVATEMSAEIKDELVEQMLANGVEVVDVDMIKTWELIAQNRMQKE